MYSLGRYYVPEQCPHATPHPTRLPRLREPSSVANVQRLRAIGSPARYNDGRRRVLWKREYIREPSCYCAAGTRTTIYSHSARIVSPVGRSLDSVHRVCEFCAAGVTARSPRSSVSARVPRRVRVRVGRRFMCINEPRANDCRCTTVTRSFIHSSYSDSFPGSRGSNGCAWGNEPHHQHT